jgi:hypothetical protein
VVDTDELEDVLTERMNPSRVLDQLRLSDIWARLPNILERSSDAIPISLSVHVRLPPPFNPTLADATLSVTPRLRPLRHQNQAGNVVGAA